MDNKKKRHYFPIRFKILLILLLVITFVVGVITFTMANLFHSDKKAYIHDLTNVISLNASDKARSLLVGYQQKLLVFTKLLFDEELFQENKSRLIKTLFEDFKDFVLVTYYEKGEQGAAIYDENQLQAAGVSYSDLLQYYSHFPIQIADIQKNKILIERSSLSDKVPMFTIAILYKRPENDFPTVVLGAVRMDHLQNLARKDGVFEIFLFDQKENLLVHSNPQKKSLSKSVFLLPQVKSLNRQEGLGITGEYTEDGVEMVGGFSHVGLGGLMVGVQIPKSVAYLTARELLNNLIGISFILLLVSAFLGLIWSHRITRPIEKLSGATRLVRDGKFDVELKNISNDEIGELADSFNQMAKELLNREDALKQAQVALIQSEKMSAFGQLGAGIAHEVKNPLAGILGYAQLSLRKLEEGNPLRKNMEIIEKETKRCKTIMENLTKFSRQEKCVQEPFDINHVVDDAIAIVSHQLKINQVQLEKESMPDLPPIYGNGNQFQQVLMNFLINSQQAMNGEPGSIKVSTHLLNPEQIEVAISDTGPGIPPDIIGKIFDPFFTTKPSGKGTGLGLSVSYGIIKEHKGEILVDSIPGKGTTFSIRIPVLKEKEVN